MRHPLIDITFEGDCFIPRSRAGDEFLRHEFALIGDVDLTADDMEGIALRAERAGLVLSEAAPSPVDTYLSMLLREQGI